MKLVGLRPSEAFFDDNSTEELMIFKNICSTVVAHWIAGQQVERAIIPKFISSSQVVPGQVSLTCTANNIYLILGLGFEGLFFEFLTTK